jgi:acylphosphatase
MHMRRVRLTASGLVQGVFFRASVRDEARRHGVTGWVSNAPDGTVEAEIQGDADAVEAMIAFCRQGPGHARVERLDVTDRDVEQHEQGFEVR